MRNASGSPIHHLGTNSIKTAPPKGITDAELLPSRSCGLARPLFFPFRVRFLIIKYTIKPLGPILNYDEAECERPAIFFPHFPSLCNIKRRDSLISFRKRTMALTINVNVFIWGVRGWKSWYSPLIVA